MLFLIDFILQIYSIKFSEQKSIDVKKNAIDLMYTDQEQNKKEKNFEVQFILK